MSKTPQTTSVVMANIFPMYLSGIEKAFKYRNNIKPAIAHTLQEILQHLEKSKDHYVVLTDDLLAQFGESCITEIREKFKTVKIIVLLNTCQVYLVKNLVALGVSTIVSKFTKGPELEQAILHVQQSDQPFYCHHILKLLASKLEISEYIGRIKVSLCPRQADFLLHMIDGLPNKVIAVEMDIKEETAKDYRKIINARIKLPRCKSPLEYGVKMGYFSMEQYVKKISTKNSFFLSKLNF